MKGSIWSAGGAWGIGFAEDGNIVHILGYQALYTIQGKKIRFYLSSFMSNLENMTEAKLIDAHKIEVKKQITQCEQEIKEAEKNKNEQQKKMLEAQLQYMKKELQQLENPDEQKKAEIKQLLKSTHKRARKMKQYAKFEGSFNNEKTQLTIEQFPVYDGNTNEVTLQKKVFEKK